MGRLDLGTCFFWDLDCGGVCSLLVQRELLEGFLFRSFFFLSFSPGGGGGASAEVAVILVFYIYIPGRGF